MAGHNGFILKRALIAWLTELYRDNPATKDVVVRYGAFGFPERDRVHGGKIDNTQAYEFLSGGTPRASREERGTVEIHIMSTRYNATIEETDARCEELGLLMENGIAADPKFGDRVTSLSWLGVVRVESDYWLADGQAGSMSDYTIGYRARLQ